MKAAAAVLGASLLFFLGVLTGAGGKESQPPPTAIPLGVATPASPASAQDGDTPATRPPAAPRTPGPTAGSPSSGGATPTTVSTVTTATTLPPGSTTEPTTPAGEPTPATTAPPSTTSTTAAPSAGAGGVEQVDGEVDCAPAGKKGKGKREPCPPTTTTDGAGGRSGR